ncbi:hypothetical protein [Rhizoctonia solani ambivirus 1]|uniref:Uncharacterized protein n=1 Tax=Rhizoctonia solani ambivirus 1 TaxID=2755408 RepID=A0A7D7IWV3_9VIRU|nr:hypothetical protein [Rhizoctonia solani ambivirus 1]
MSSITTTAMRDYYDLVSRLFPPHLQLAKEIRYMPLKARSVLIKLCQAQVVPPAEESNTLYNLLRATAPYYSPTNRDIRPVHYLAIEFHQLFEGPLWSAITLDILRSCPLEAVEVDKAIFAGWNKEIACCETVSAPPKVNWHVFFHPELWQEMSVIPGVPPNSRMNKFLLDGIDRILSRVSKKIHYPRMTHKNMSRDTRREYEQATGLSLEDVPIFGQDDWWKFYDRTGIKLGGACEMRLKWYPSGAKPRCYYAQGGWTYQHSCYLQDFFTELVNSNPITHHVSRLRHGRLIIPSNRRLLIYDLTSFTSQMDEQKYFVEELANYCSGAMFPIIDPREGQKLQDLGDLLHTYNEECNIYPAVSYERFPGFDKDVISEHARASMLGIFGNLMSCTLAHGIAVAQTVETPDELNVAGDDAAVAENVEDPFLTDYAIRSVGEYERSKTFYGDEVGAIALKRPIHIEGDRPVMSVNIVPPSLTMILHQLGIEDPRYFYPPELVTDSERISSIGKDLMRFLTSLHYRLPKVTEDEVLYAFDMFRAISRLLNQPSGGKLPNLYMDGYWPCWETPEDIEIHPVNNLVFRNYQGYANIPLFETDEDDHGPEHYAGSRWVGTMTRHLSFLEKLGYLEVSAEITRVVEGYDGYLELLSYLKFDEYRSRLYRFLVIREIPDHLLYDELDNDD